MRRINKCLNKQLLNLCQKSIQIESLNLNVKKYLPSHLQEKCSVRSFEKGIMIFVTNDPVWASELRYCLSEIRDTLRKDAGLYQLISTKIVLRAF